MNVVVRILLAGSCSELNLPISLLRGTACIKRGMGQTKNREKEKSEKKKTYLKRVFFFFFSSLYFVLLFIWDSGITGTGKVTDEIGWAEEEKKVKLNRGR